MRQLEKELEVKAEKAAVEMEEYTKNSEKNIEVLKNYADLERQQWEKRL